MGMEDFVPTLISEGQYCNAVVQKISDVNL